MRRKITQSDAVSGSMLARSLAIVIPAAEKALSLLADVAGIARIRRASAARRGNFSFFSRHQRIGQLSSLGVFEKGKFSNLLHFFNVFL